MKPAFILHELTLLQEREGWLPEPELRALAERIQVPLHRIESLSTFYTHFRRAEPKKHVIAVCRDLSCMLAGGRQRLAALQAQYADDPDVQIEEVSCIGRCEHAPAGFVGHDPVALDDDAAVKAALQGGGGLDVPQRRWDADLYESADEHYGNLRQLVAAWDPARAVQRLKDCNLRGLGGAGFPTGLKWELVGKEPATPKYVICNADESEPGTFKDRAILHDLPHLVIEGMVLGAMTVGSERGWVFIRHEYEAERHALQQAIDRAYSVGALGKNIFDSGFSFDLDVFVSPGGYILGEETALLECMEDQRGEPRNKPPFPGNQGLWGQPTLINNVETYAHAAGIVARGVEWWDGLGKGDFSGHKFISVSGDVARPDVYLIAMGSTLRELLEMAGGMADGKSLAAIAPGGASSNFLPASSLDVEIDFKTLADAGSMLGSGAAVFVAEGNDLLDVGVNVTTFFRNESCGKCVPCRVGSEKAVELLQGRKDLPAGADQLLEELNETMVQTSICGLGQVALGPLMSILRNFPDQVQSE
ncbi:MAG: NAD(P)H-dependent oxidoreductase subunit E [Planctomycetota bacterium]